MGSIEVLERKLNTLKRQESLNEEKIVEKREEISERQIIKDNVRKIFRKILLLSCSRKYIFELFIRIKRIVHFWFHLALKSKKKKLIVIYVYYGNEIRYEILTFKI